MASKEVEYIACCPKCKTFETVWFLGRKLQPTRKFRQEKGNVYHDCGATEPCMLLAVEKGG